MPVPKDVRSVPRPVNTVVVDNGGNGPECYAVRERKSSSYQPGIGSRPINGRVVDRIRDGRDVPIGEERAHRPELPAVLSYGASALAYMVSEDLFSDLLEVFPLGDAVKIIVIASLRALKPGITAERLAMHYERTWLSICYPGAALSEGTVEALLCRIGEYTPLRRRFYELRMRAAAPDSHIAIGGMPRRDAGAVHDLSRFSCRPALAGCRPASLAYAFDVERMEPLCAEVFPGSRIDANACARFVEDSGARGGIVMASEALPASEVADLLKERPDLHFIAPLERSDKRILDNSVLDFKAVLTGVQGGIFYTKKQIQSGRCLYAFKDRQLAAAEATAYCSMAKMRDGGGAGDYGVRKDFFGVVVLESDLDMEPLVAYLAHAERRSLELVLNTCSSDPAPRKAGIESRDFVLGNEFIDFVSAIITCRILQKARQSGLLEKSTYGNLMEDLMSAWRLAAAPRDELPATGDAHWFHPSKRVCKEMERLGLCRPEPKKPGRKPKARTGDPSCEGKKKRGPGRPRKTTE